MADPLQDILPVDEHGMLDKSSFLAKVATILVNGEGSMRVKHQDDSPSENMKLEMSIAINGFLFLLFLLLFIYLRSFPQYQVVYAPRVHHPDVVAHPPRLSNNFFRLCYELWSYTDSDVLKYAGLDALMFLKFVSMSIILFVLLFVIGASIVLPLNYVGNNDKLHLARFTMVNLKPGVDSALVHFIFSWIMSFAVYIALERLYKDFVNLRHVHMSKDNPQNYCLLVSDIPSQYQSREKVESFFHNFFYDNAINASMVTDTSKIEKLRGDIDAQVALISESERQLAAEVAAAASQEKRSCSCECYCSCCKGPTQEYIDKLKKDLEEMQRSLSDVFAKEQRCLGSAFISFNKLSNVAKCSQVIISNNPKLWRVSPAPGASNVNWTAIGRYTLDELRKKNAESYILTLLVVVFFTIPVAFVSALTSYEVIEKQLPDVAKYIASVSVVSKDVIGGWLSSLVLLIFTTCLPYLMWRLAYHQELPSLSLTDESVLKKMFIFQVVHVYFTSAIAASIFQIIGQVIKSTPWEIIQMLAVSFPSASIFFCQYVLLLSINLLGELLRPIYLLYKMFQDCGCCVKKRKAVGGEREEGGTGNLVSPTNTEKEEAYSSWNPGWVYGHLGYGYLYSTCLLVFIIGLTYTVMAPLTLLFVIVFFMTASFVFKHNCMYVYVTPFDDGRLWPAVFKRLIVGLVVAQLTLVGIFSTYNIWYSVFLAPLPVISFVFYFQTDEDLNKQYWTLPLQFASDADEYRMKNLQGYDDSHAAIAPKHYVSPWLTKENDKNKEV